MIRASVLMVDKVKPRVRVKRLEKFQFLVDKLLNIDFAILWVNIYCTYTS